MYYIIESIGYISLHSVAHSISPGLVYGEQKAFPDVGHGVDT